MESRIRCGSKECSNPVGQQPVLDKRLTGGRAMIRSNQPQALLISSVLDSYSSVSKSSSP